MSKYKFQFRKSFEVLFHGTVYAKTERDADKKLRKFAKDCYPESSSDCIDFNSDFRPLDDGDDFNIYGDQDE